MNQSGSKFHQVISQQCGNIQLQSQNEIAQEYDLMGQKFDKIDKLEKQQNEVNICNKQKPNFITFDEIKKIQEMYFYSIKDKQNLQSGDNTRSAGKYQWSQKFSCFTFNQKTQLREDGLINVNSKQKLINTPVLPQQNQFKLQVQFKLRRGQQIQIKSVGVDRKLLKRLVFTVFHTGYSLKLKALVPFQYNILKIWKQMEMPLKFNQDNNIVLKIFQNIQGKIFITISQIQFALFFKLPSIPIFYFLICVEIVQKITLQQTPNQQIKPGGNCSTNCAIF